MSSRFHNSRVSIYLVLLAAVFLVPLVLAHSPLTPGDNESLETAALITDPTKSWAVYSELHEGGEAQYYRFEISEGQKIYVMLLKSTAVEDDDFLPGLVLMGPDIPIEGTVPDYVEVPQGARSMVVEGTQPSGATYEPFSPSSFYELAKIDLEAPATGTYYVAVYEPYRGGHYSIAVGEREEYTLSEWILIPVSLISVYQWGGYSLAVIFAPLVVVIALGLGFIVWRQMKRGVSYGLFNWVGAIAGLLFLGTAAMTLLQMALALAKTGIVSEVWLTVLFALGPVIVGIVVLWLVLRSSGKVNLRKRAELAILGVIALFVWAGLLVGPVLAVIASALPARSDKTPGKA